MVYVPRLTNRLGYTLNVLLHHVLGMEYDITTDEALFQHTDSPKLCYAERRVGEAVWIKSSSFMFETRIAEQQLTTVDYAGGRAPFAVYGRDIDFPFDMLSAAFYLLSRYEEYLPHRVDVHGRFRPEECWAMREGVLEVPVVNVWARTLAEVLQQRYDTLVVGKPEFSFECTIDIDAAYCYRNKGVLRGLIGFAKDIAEQHSVEDARRRWRTLRGKEPDPFDTFDYILSSCRSHGVDNLLFFPLMGNYGLYDKSISYLDEDFRQLLQHLSDYARLGIHSSYASADDGSLIPIEKERLSRTIHHTVRRNRCHFLRMRMPTTYRALLGYGIDNDYTMGYATAIGFRAGLATPYPFYDLGNDYETTLMIHPFAMMDTTLKKYMQLSPAEALEQVGTMMDRTAAVGGTFSAIFHNENLSEHFGWQGWRTFFEGVLDRAYGIKKTEH